MLRFPAADGPAHGPKKQPRKHVAERTISWKSAALRLRSGALGGGALIHVGRADESVDGSLKGLDLEQLGSIEVITVTKAPREISRTPAAIYVLTSDDIRRSGATSIPEVLRLVPGV